MSGSLIIDRQTEAGARLLDCLFGTVHAVRGDVQRGPVLVQLLLADGAFLDQWFIAGEIALSQHQTRLFHFELCNVRLEQFQLILDVLDRVFELVPIAPGLRHDAPQSILGGRKVGLGRLQCSFLQGNLDVERLAVDADQKVPLMHGIVVVHQHLDDLAGNARGHDRHMPIDVRVVGRNRVERTDHQRSQIDARQNQRHRAQPKQ